MIQESNIMASNGNIVLDLTNYKDRVGSRVAPGTYRVVVDDTELTKSQAGNEMINVWFRVVGGEFNGSTITDRLTITEKALFRVVGFMNAIGMATPKKRLSLNPSSFVGKTLDIQVDDGEPYNGRVRSEVRAYVKVAKSAQPVEEDIEDVAPEDTEGTEESAPEETSAKASKSAPADQGEVDLDDLENL